MGRASESGGAAVEGCFAADGVFVAAVGFVADRVLAVAAGFAADGVFAAAVGFVSVDVLDAAERVAVVGLALVAAGFAAAARRVPIRSGLVDGSAASTPFSSFFGFAFFFGFSTLSAMALRVYGSRSGRGARPPSTWHPDDSAAPSYTLWVTFVRSRD
ncbi:MAG TPA: hypothetical protein VK631_03295 [Solirubrobacteraceae bacterium]|nr:hypothetical protein [Solirubrobacteraceae bacterium]